MQKDMLKEVEKAVADLLQTMSHFNQRQFNTVPHEGSWTAGEVAEHIYKSIEGLPKLLHGDVKVTTRNPEEKVSIIESIFLDFTSKMKSPDYIQPTIGDKQQDKLYKDLEAKGQEIIATAKELDLRLLYTDFSLPHMGEFTGIEWLAFMVSHMKRHTHQMNKILAALEK